MKRELVLRNRQRIRAIDLRLLRRIGQKLLDELLPGGQIELGVHLVTAAEMEKLNRHFLEHEGPTDVITFDYAFGVPSSGGQVMQKPMRGNIALRNRRKAELQTVHGEIFICLDEAVSQARQFRATWQSEVVRYLVHGLLHLRGYDDLQPAARRAMKREENRLLRELSNRFTFANLGKGGIRRRSEIRKS